MASRDHTERGGRNDGGTIPFDNKPPSPSSSSDESGTLHEDGSPTDVRVGSEGTGTTSHMGSPIDDMTMINNSRFFRNGSKFFDDKPNPGDAGFIPNDLGQNSPIYPREPSRNFRSRNAVTPIHGGGGTAYRTSRTWVSPDAQHMQEFQVVRNAMRRLFKHSEVAKWKYQDYIAHREAMLASQKAQLSRTVQQKEQERELNAPHMDNKAMSSLVKLLPGNQNLTMQGNVGRVLGQKTIWCPDWMHGKEEIAPWPTFAEMKWEGDDRAKTGVGRYLPLPREPGAPGIPWNQLQVVEQYPMDQVQLIPTMEDIYLPVDEIEDEDKWQFLDKALEDAMDEYLES